MKKAKRLIALVLTLATLLSVCLFNVSAADEGISVYGTSVPTTAYYLSNGSYSATFSSVSAGIYTSKYFVANDSSILVSFSNVTTTSSSSNKVAYWLYNMTSGYYVESEANYTSSTTSGGTSASGSHAFQSTTGYKYYVWFRAHNTGSVSGKIKVL